MSSNSTTGASILWCPRQASNLHVACATPAPQAGVSSDSTTRAMSVRCRLLCRSSGLAILGARYAIWAKTSGQRLQHPLGFYAPTSPRSSLTAAIFLLTGSLKIVNREKKNFRRWCVLTGSNRRHSPCKGAALPS